MVTDAGAGRLAFAVVELGTGAEVLGFRVSDARAGVDALAFVVVVAGTGAEAGPLGFAAVEAGVRVAVLGFTVTEAGAGTEPLVVALVETGSEPDAGVGVPSFVVVESRAGEETGADPVDFPGVDAGDDTSGADLVPSGMSCLADASAPFPGLTVSLPTPVLVAISGFEVSVHGADCVLSIGFVFTHPTEGNTHPQVVPVTIWHLASSLATQLLPSYEGTFGWQSFAATSPLSGHA